MAWSVCWCQARAELGLCVAGMGAICRAERLCPRPSLWALETPSLLGDAGASLCRGLVVLRGHAGTLCSGSLNNNAVLWFSLVGLRSHPPGAKVQKLKMWGGGKGGEERREGKSILAAPPSEAGLSMLVTRSLLTLTVRPGSRGYSVLAYGCGT